MEVKTLRERTLETLTHYLMATGDQSIFYEARRRTVKALTAHTHKAVVAAHLNLSERAVYRELSEKPIPAEGPLLVVLQFCTTPRTVEEVLRHLRSSKINVVGGTVTLVEEWLRLLVSQGFLEERRTSNLHTFQVTPSQ